MSGQEGNKKSEIEGRHREEWIAKSENLGLLFWALDRLLESEFDGLESLFYELPLCFGKVLAKGLRGNGWADLLSELVLVGVGMGEGDRKGLFGGPGAGASVKQHAGSVEGGDGLSRKLLAKA